jgi:hypothetical protein
MNMRSAIFAIALLSGSAALAQTEVVVPADTTMTVASTGQVAMPSNAAPERDARGIAVISDPATVPAGYNGTPDTLNGTGGPLLDTAGEPAAAPDPAYPACTRTVTDNCVQTYERHRR